MLFPLIDVFFVLSYGAVIKEMKRRSEIRRSPSVLGVINVFVLTAADVDV
jgi:hypothetical protein